MAESLMQPDAALADWLARMEPTGTEQVALAAATGRILAQPLRADRDSPPHDVSAMDGYAVKLGDLATDRLPVAGEVLTGQRPPAIAPGSALRIFTGGCVPRGAEAVVRREDVDEINDAIRLRIDPARINAGMHIRRQGENLRAGDIVVEAGCAVDATVAGALSAFGVASPFVHRRVRVGLIVTGDELRNVNDPVQPWQVRDSNGAALEALLAPLPWIERIGREQVADRPARLRERIAAMLETCDALLLTGGVSMGDHDHVPGAVRQVGGEVVFHRLAIRPGKPVLGAVGPGGQAIAALPGNPVSVLVTARVFASAALRKRAGLAIPEPPRPVVRLAEDRPSTLNLWWHRPARFEGDGLVRPVASMGSGDMVSAARSDGFVRIPPGESGPGPWPWWPWTMD